MYQITVRTMNEIEDIVYLKKIEAGQTLLEVFLQNGIEVNHECGGIASCTTCYLYVEKGAAFLEPAATRELHILKKKNKEVVDGRLACQCLLLEGDGEIEVKLPAQ